MVFRSHRLTLPYQEDDTLNILYQLEIFCHFAFLVLALDPKRSRLAQNSYFFDLLSVNRALKVQSKSVHSLYSFINCFFAAHGFGILWYK